MKEEHVIEMKVSEQAFRQVMNRVTRAHVRGLSIEKAKELGIFQRMSLLLCGMHSLNAAAYRVYGGVDYLLEILGADKKHEIRVACGAFQRAFDDFMNFWSRYYNGGEAQMEMNGEVEELYHQFMRWAQLPESWGLGDPQNTEDDTDSLLVVREDGNDRELKFYPSTLSSEIAEDIKESWMVTRYNRRTHQQVSEHEDMDKASAQMVARRLSAEDPENLYTASCVREYDQHVVEVLPMKAYKKDTLISNVRKVLKK